MAPTTGRGARKRVPFCVPPAYSERDIAARKLRVQQHHILRPCLDLLEDAGGALQPVFHLRTRHPHSACGVGVEIQIRHVLNRHLSFWQGLPQKLNCALNTREVCAYVTVPQGNAIRTPSPGGSKPTGAGAGLYSEKDRWEVLQPSYF